MSNIHFSSNSNEWYTPSYVFNELNKRYKFTLDAAANENNAKCDRFFTQEDDGLKQCWANESVWLNPPYGREIGKWVKKAKMESEKGSQVVMLIPARTETKYWHEYIFPHASKILFVSGRLKFGGAPNNAPFPSAVIVFGGDAKQEISTIDFKGVAQ